MMVNSTHIPRLVSMGVIRDKNDLLNKPCLNVQIGTWILAKHFQVCGVSWNCTGSYNAGFRPDRHETRERYANRIWKIYQRQTGLNDSLSYRYHFSSCVCHTCFYRVRHFRGGTFKAGTSLSGRSGGGYLTPLCRRGGYLAVCGNGFADTYGTSGLDDTYRNAVYVQFLLQLGVMDATSGWLPRPFTAACLCSGLLFCLAFHREPELRFMETAAMAVVMGSICHGVNRRRPQLGVGDVWLVCAPVGWMG